MPQKVVGSAPVVREPLALRREVLADVCRRLDAADVHFSVGVIGAGTAFYKAAVAQGHFGQFRGECEAELVAWLRRILATNLANLVRHYRGTRRRDVRLERRLAVEPEQSSRELDRGLATKQSRPSQRAIRCEQVMRLTDALEYLPDDYREVIILRQLEDRGKTERSGEAW
jgi:DNA-directed RNA polymerase specialized sigma24 family protein